MLIRASIGTLAKLGLQSVKSMEEPFTAYFLQYSKTGCLGGCLYCTQSWRFFKGDWLGKMVWPSVELSEVLAAWRDVFERICFQTVIKEKFIEEAVEFVRAIRGVSSRPLSLAITPVPAGILEEFKRLGVDTLGVGLDTLTEELFVKWGKPYTWSLYWRFIESGVRVFGRGNVYVHVIAGLGESLKEALETLVKIYSTGARVALFNYFDPASRRSIDKGYYRILQIAVELLESGENPLEYIDVDSRRFRRQPRVDFYRALQTRGCPGCNRPFYTELPSSIYNYPSLSLLREQWGRVREELESIGVRA